MNLRILGFVLIAVGVVGTILAFASLDQNSASRLTQFGLGYTLSRGETFGGLQLGFVLGSFVALAFAGVGFLIFGKKE